MADSFKNEASDYCLYEWVTESLTHLIRSKTWIHSVTKHRCVARRHKTVLLWLWLKLRQRTWAKTVKLYYKLQTLCQLNSQWRTSTPTTCLQADVSVRPNPNSILYPFPYPLETECQGVGVKYSTTIPLHVIICHLAPTYTHNGVH